MKKTRLKLGERSTPPWVADRIAERPPWRCRTPDEIEHFTEFVLEDLRLRWVILGSEKAEQVTRILSEPDPTDGRRKPERIKIFDPVESAAQAIPIIREIFEDYWPEGRDTGRVYRGHDPSAEDIAAAFAGVTSSEVTARAKRSNSRRHKLK